MKELEGNIIKYICGDSSLQGKVVGFDYDVGITIVEEENPDINIFCTAGPSSPLWNTVYTGNKVVYDKLFNLVVEQVKEGFLDTDKLTTACVSSGGVGDNTGPGGVPAGSCPFGQ